MNTYTFIISSLIIILIPGTGVIYTISTGLLNGKKASVYAAAGCTLGILPHLCASIVLSSLLLSMNQIIFSVIKIAGVIYLLYLGGGMLFSKEENGGSDFITMNDRTISNRGTQIMKKGVLINLLNPKLTLFFFSFLPQYVSGKDTNYLLECMLYGLGFMLLTLIVFIGYGILAGMTSQFLEKHPKGIIMMQRVFGGIFIIFAIQLGVSAL